MATAAGAPAQIIPGKALGFIVLGSSLQYTLSLLRTYEKVFTSISTIYDTSSPLTAPIIILLDANGIRLRFDGPDQRLRLIEILDFGKCRLTYNSGELTRAGTSPGPTCRNVYNKLFGPTFPGEYIPSQNLYVLSYPGVAFSFPVPQAQKDDTDFVSLLASTPAANMALFVGESWAAARDELFTRPVTAPRLPTSTSAAARLSAANDEIELIRILPSDRIELVRRHNPPFTITLHSTTPQDLITELGPPRAIYRKTDKRLTIHRTRRPSIETSHSDASDDDADDSTDPATGDCFYNYFHHGFDVFVSAARSARNPVATKVIVHGNVPGSFEFQRYRRCRWEIALPDLSIHSEQAFDEMGGALQGKFGEVGQPMPYFRGHDVSPSSSCELLGGWDDGKELQGRKGVEEDGTVTYGKVDLFGFEGFIFEVLKSRKAVTGLTVF